MGKKQNLTTSPFEASGFTMQEPPPLEYGLTLLDWMATHGLNRLELRISGRTLWFDVPGYPELGPSPESRRMQKAREAVGALGQLIRHGRARGIRVVPAIGHADGLQAFVEARPEWRVDGRIMHPTGVDINQTNFCFRHPGLQAAYQAIVQAAADQFEPDEIQFWMTENRVYCECPRCRAACPGGDMFALAEDRFLVESRLLYECVQKVRQTGTPVEISLWTTQGSRPHNDVMVRALPNDVLWFYYDGERRGCYNLRHRRMIPPEIHGLINDGYRIGLQLDWSSCGVFLSPIGTIREACAEAAEAGIRTVCGWVEAMPLNLQPSVGGASPVFAYAAAMCRQPAAADDEASIATVMGDAARQAGHTADVADAAGCAWQLLAHWGREIHLADKYCFWWHSNNVPGAICERIARRAPVDEIDQRWADVAWDETVPALDAAGAALTDRAVELRTLPDASGYLATLADQLDLAAIWAQCCRSAYWAGIVFHRMGGWDSVHGPWRDDQTELRTTLEKLETARARFDARKSIDSRLIGRMVHFDRRMAVFKDQIDRALKAVNEGACPAALPRQDAYPYLPAQSVAQD